LPRHGTNLIVHFAGPGAAVGLGHLREALAARRRKAGAIFVVVVVPRGALDRSPAVDANVAWARSEDADGAWAKAFEITSAPATVLVDPQGRTVWRQVGRSDAASLLAALDEHLVLGGRLSWRLVRPTVRTGDRAPDFSFEYRQGRTVALRTLRGREPILCFWKSWSAPCLAELERLQQLATPTARGPLILAINDGEDPNHAGRWLSEHGFRFRLVADPQRVIARRYGIDCWPTTLAVDGRGTIREIRLGSSSVHRHGGALRARATGA
jgi:peroxiredoxin